MVQEGQDHVARASTLLNTYSAVSFLVVVHLSPLYSFLWKQEYPCLVSFQLHGFLDARLEAHLHTYVLRPSLTICQIRERDSALVTHHCRQHA